MSQGADFSRRPLIPQIPPLPSVFGGSSDKTSDSTNEPDDLKALENQEPKASDFKLPPHLAQRLEAEQKEFGKNTSAEELKKDMEEVERRKEAHDKHVSEFGAAEVNKAKEIAGHGKLQEHKESIESQLRELEELEQKIKQVDQKKDELEHK
ncbi:hypothetical protein BT69DRAFT_1346043 [Atractiella rhizophila]|nr:hypothetical protein BT69DRAFT_1346043 [Atractiella rhizophila]